MKIEVKFEELVQTVEYENVRMGITIKSDTELTKDQIDGGTNTLMLLAKKAIKKQIEKLKIERGIV